MDGICLFQPRYSFLSLLGARSLDSVVLSFTTFYQQHPSSKGCLSLPRLSLLGVTSSPKTFGMASSEPPKRPASAASSPKSEPPSKKRPEASEWGFYYRALNSRLIDSDTHCLNSLQSSLEKSASASACTRTSSASKATSSGDASAVA